MNAESLHHNLCILNSTGGFLIIPFLFEGLLQLPKCFLIFRLIVVYIVRSKDNLCTQYVKVYSALFKQIILFCCTLYNLIPIQNLIRLVKLFKFVI